MKRLTIALLIVLCCVAARAAALDPALADLRSRWDHANFDLEGDAREQALKRLADEAARLASERPGQADALVWQAITLSSLAGAEGGLGALGKVEQARDLLLEAEGIDPQVLDGSVYTSLGSLYYQVPGWPLGFGDDDKARVYLEKALALNPNGIEANYFYGDFLLREGEYAEAAKALSRALAAPSRPGREAADRGRRAQAREALAEAKGEGEGLMWMSD